MAGTWMSIVEGFGGMRVKENTLSFNPFLPEQWISFAFTIGFRGIQLNVKVKKDEIIINTTSEELLHINIFNKLHPVTTGETVINYKGLLV